MGVVDAGVAGCDRKGDLGRSSGSKTSCRWAVSVGSMDGAPGAGQGDREISLGRLEMEIVEAVELQQTRREVRGRDVGSASSRTH